MANGRFPGATHAARRVALVVAVLLAVGLTGPPTATRAADGTISTGAQGLRASITLLNGLGTVPLTTQESAWQTGQAVDSATTESAELPVLGTPLLTAGAITGTAGPATGGGTGEAGVAGLTLLSASILGADAISTRCVMSSAGISGGTEAVNLKVAGETLNPGVNTAITIPDVATGTADKQTATYSTGTGRLAWTLRGLDLSLLGGGVPSGVGDGTIVVAESTCSGIVTLAAIGTTSTPITPGDTGTPTVTVTDNGDVAAPNTVITIPAPPTGYTLGPVSTDGGGTCAPDKTRIRCTGVTVPGSGSVTVSLPVTLAGSAAAAAKWAPGPDTITAVSTPIAALTGTTISVSGSGTLATAGEPAVNPTAGEPAVNPTAGEPAGNPTAGEAAVNPTGGVTIAGNGPIDRIVPKAPRDAHVAGTTSDTGPPGRRTAHEGGPASASPSAATPNDNSDSGGDGTDNNASSRGTTNAGGSLPEAGQDLSGLLVLSVMLVVGGIAALIVARNRPRRRPAAGAF